jgi:septal ring factor EnvC (AmiA/AmiB activator)
MADTFIDKKAAPLVESLRLEITLLSKTLGWDQLTQTETQCLLQKLSVYDDPQHTITTLVSLIHLWAGQIHFLVHHVLFPQERNSPGESTYSFKNLTNSFAFLLRRLSETSTQLSRSNEKLQDLEIQNGMMKIALSKNNPTAKALNINQEEIERRMAKIEQGKGLASTTSVSTQTDPDETILKYDESIAVLKKSLTNAQRINVEWKKKYNSIVELYQTLDEKYKSKKKSLAKINSDLCTSQEALAAEQTLVSKQQTELENIKLRLTMATEEGRMAPYYKQKLEEAANLPKELA